MVEAGMGFWSSRAEGFLDIDLKCVLQGGVGVSSRGEGFLDIDLNCVLQGDVGAPHWNCCWKPFGHDQM